MPHDLWNLDHLDVSGQRVLLRADLDVPLVSAGGTARVAEDHRLRAALATIDELRCRGARVVVIGHLADPSASMQPVASRLESLMGVPVRLTAGVAGTAIQDMTERLRPGEVLMLENALSTPGERQADPALAAAWAALADLHVNDAFASAHQRLASTWGVAQHLQSAAGRVMEREVYALTSLIEEPARPFVAAIGGTGNEVPAELMNRLLEIADAVCIGGTAWSSLAATLGRTAEGSPVGDRGSLSVLLSTHLSHRLVLPSDIVLGTRSAGDGGWGRLNPRNGIAERLPASDIGPRTAAEYADQISRAGTVFWSGPMGSFDAQAFSSGTREVAFAVGYAAGTTVAAGETTAAALRHFGVEDRVSHVSVGGPAMVALLQRRELPGVTILQREPQLCR